MPWAPFPPITETSGTATDISRLDAGSPWPWSIVGLHLQGEQGQPSPRSLCLCLLLRIRMSILTCPGSTPSISEPQQPMVGGTFYNILWTRTIQFPVPDTSRELSFFFFLI